jgi:phospholipase/carboxylesterase
MRRRLLLLCLCGGLAVRAASAQAPASTQALEVGDWGIAAGLRYRELVRPGIHPDDALPMLIVIHGRGDRVERDSLRSIDVDSRIPLRRILPQAPLPLGDDFAWFEQRWNDHNPSALAREIDRASEQLASMIGELKRQRPTRDRVVVSGFSQGGMLCFALALKHPELVEFALPIAGALPEPLWPEAAAPSGRLPELRALHGASDAIVSFAADQQLVDHLGGLGYPAELTPFPGIGHILTPAMSRRARTLLTAALSARH